MAKTKVIVTRNTSGYVDIWPYKANPTKNTSSGIWRARLMHIVGGRECVIKSIKVIFGFTPRRGSKKTLEITTKRKR